ncbi:hypothetical protein FA15DRAFT_633789 [Coprinopsis marcescibilis]|uniref:BHLH domain-containing protein n=1 Tax=Coprinopsis marcescibilis TaxID=230819 RepID=A0A5C3L7A6_COPMA|nr:hypothetical protein FA15DRAFT_633789 [Coprinopsis marcescibilis]
MATDLGLDPSDPLNLLLHNSSQNNDSLMDESTSDGSSPPDWSQLSSLWDGSESVGGGLKPYPDLMDFSELNTLPMDMDFNPAMGMDPGALHYDPLKFNMPFSFEDAAAFHNVSAEMIPPQFTFTFQGAMNASASSFSSASSSSLSSPESLTKERRLSVTSSSSSSGASLSPVMESLASPSTSYSSDASSPSPAVPKLEVKTENFRLDPAAEIAESVRQSAGVMLAVPMSADLSSQVLAQSIMAAGNLQNKVPISRLPRATGSRSPISSSSSAASTPPPSTPPMNNAHPGKLIINAKPLSASASSSALHTPTPSAPQQATGSRPKTSHTTIERRYRTNLNARIQSLRMAVPALRVLEDRDGGNGKKIKKNLKDGVYVKGAGIGIDTEDGTTVDVIDVRGFVDGVKVARKCSKANVLGKAVEYIRVLKKREQRLKAEQAGMKALICGLVGGPALLKEWEIRWRERFGGEEKDEVEGEDAEDDDSDDDEGDDDDEVGKKRKRAKTSAAPAKKPVDRKPAPSPIVTTPVAELDGTLVNGAPVPEKRKRGRPRKVVPPPAPAVTSAPHISHQQAAAVAQQQQMDQMMHSPEGHQQGQAPQYMLAVFALFSFFNSPLTSQFASKAAHQHTGVVLTPPLALSPEIVSQYSRLPAVDVPQLFQVSWAWKDYLQFLHLFVSALVLGAFVWNWVSVTFRTKGKAPASTAAASREGKTNWSAVCDEAVLKGDTSSMSAVSLARMYHALSSSKSATVTQLGSLSLAIYNARGPFSYVGNLKAHSLWRQAKVESELIQTKRSSKPAVRSIEKLVMETFTLEEAAKAVASATPREKSNGEAPFTPVEILGSIVVKQRVKQHLGQLFVEAVSLSQDDIVEREQENDTVKQREQEMRRTIEAARELGGDVEELGRLLERVWRGTVLDDFDAENSAAEDVGPEDGVDAEIQSLLVALVLYRRMFSGSNTPKASSLLISPPPSPTLRTSQENGPLLALRKALGSWVFEDGDREGSMEDAKDKVVDLIVDMERRGRSATPMA